MLRCLSFVACLALCVGPGAAQARVPGQPAEPLDAAALAGPARPAPPGLGSSESWALSLPPDSTPAALGLTELDSRAASPSLRLPGADNPALASDIARLRAAALATVGPGPRAGRAPANASWVLGLLYLHGIGVAASPADAVAWFDRARMLGEPLAPAGLAWCEIDGCRGPANPAAARRWIALLRPVNLPRAQFLQWLVEARLAPLQIAAPGPRNEPAAAALPSRALLLSAAQGGDIHAQIELGFESLAANRPAEALGHFRAAAARSPAASANAALLAERLAGAASNQPLPAATPTSPDATLALAQRNHRGDGRPANFVEAIRLYQLATSQGSVQAKKMLELIFSRPAADGQIDIAWMQQLAYVSLSSDAPSLDGTAARQALRREPTALVDLLPQPWRSYAPGTRR